MIHEIEKQIKAVFGRQPNERASVTLTEAEAAAVYALRSGMAVGETFIVCDAGGGTTDVNILKVRSAGLMELEALSYVEGRAVGSTLIDYEVEKIVERRLEAVRGHLRKDFHAVIDRVMDSFTSYKCNFGADRYNHQKYPLPIQDLGPGLDFPEASIEDSNVIITQCVASAETSCAISKY